MKGKRVKEKKSHARENMTTRGGDLRIEGNVAFPGKSGYLLVTLYANNTAYGLLLTEGKRDDVEVVDVVAYCKDGEP